MSQHDESELLERFRQRLSAIEAQVPEPPARDFARTGIRRRADDAEQRRVPALVALLASFVVLAVVLGPLLWGALPADRGASPSPAGDSAAPRPTLVAVPTQERPEPGTPQGCPAALAFGELVEHPEWGIALAADGQPGTDRVLWPHGFAGVWESDRLALVDGNGRAVAYVGDQVELGGGFIGNNSWLACGEIRVVAAASPSASPPPASTSPSPSNGPTLAPSSEPTAPPPSVGNIRDIPEGPLVGRSHHSAVWTGSEMIVWGGLPDGGEPLRQGIPIPDGAAYLPATDTWRPIPNGLLAARFGHSAVWTASEMIVWGGNAGHDGGILADGAAYDPATDTWRLISSGPAGRTLHTAVWTGTEMIVWGGVLASGEPRADGAAYDPATDTWRDLPPLPVEPRSAHSAVWTGDSMIVWGGDGPGPGNELDDGLLYDPTDQSGTRIAPDHLLRRAGHSAVWTGERMIVWGGTQGRPAAREPFSDGLAYDPSTGSWSMLNLVPSPGRFSHSAVWTGSEMLVWGGRTSVSGPASADGFAYDPEALHGCADLVDLPPVSDDSNTDSANEVAEIVFTAEGANDQLVRIRYTDPACRSHSLLGPYIEMLLEE